MKRFLIVIDDVSEEMARSLNAVLEVSSCRYWHWMTDLWLLVDPEPGSSAAGWLERIHRIKDRATGILVLDISRRAWAGSVPEGSEEWLRQNWKGRELESADPAVFGGAMDELRFDEWTSEDRERVLRKRIDVDLVVNRDALGFSNIEKDLPSIDLSKPFRVPPAVASDDDLKKLVGLARDDDAQSRWIRTMARVHLNGGDILYRKIDRDNFEAQIRFSADDID
ncbi:MAG TPA: hypothetical protein VHB47_02275 [Thermoanaerobaculia bacterium]|jgi:hypothetical protein|nr:hypothetical protein [Thermoanaerobaculia bacterium]